jgi:hypothetical protein
MMLFEQATRQKLRIQTSKGNACVEDLWDMSLTELNKIAVGLNKELKASKEESFLETRSSADITTKLRFDVVLYVLNVKKDEKVAREAAAETKAKKDKLLGILAKKQDAALENLSAEELELELAKL